MIDEIDNEILNILQEDARTSNAEIARRIGMAPSATLERIRKLEKRELIQGYTTRLNAKNLGLTLTAFTLIHVNEPVGQVDTGKELAKFPEVMEVHYTAGAATYLIKVRVADTQALADLLQSIGRIENVRDTNSTIVLRTIKETSDLSLSSVPGFIDPS
ncbi:Lrp/AsnC family transcriptional regulator [Desulfovibrio inopinatus]|uniref:Lrp/AsnC family transcriptional regulator n=1 Tax=Desulfovibrio inopinatus TaxID=102109 RepID=UPI00048094BA|nr:Lrp/AsnC family transcriptional regulator [Desulfovibrio inopinatus]